MPRNVAAVLLRALAVWLAAGIGLAQEPSNRDFFVRKEVQLRQAPSLLAPSLGLLSPGTLLTLVVTEPQGLFGHVRTGDGREGWVFGGHMRSLAVLEAEELLEPFGGLGPAALGRGTFSALAAKSCPTSIAQCPAQGCTADLDHQRANKLKRKMPSQAHAATVIDFDDLAALQKATDHRGVPQGEVLSLPDRLKLKGLDAGSHVVSEGDFVALTGFIAVDRDSTCGGGESVNCRLTSSGGTCNGSDIHVPIVRVAGGTQVESVVVEPIPQGAHVDAWTPAALKAVQKANRRVLIRGGLFYDSQHIINTGSGPTSQPKRFTVWEIHPVTAVLVCTKAGADCDPAQEEGWKPLEG